MNRSKQVENANRFSKVIKQLLSFLDPKSIRLPHRIYGGSALLIILVLFLGLVSFYFVNKQKSTWIANDHSHQLLRNMDSIDMLFKEIGINQVVYLTNTNVEPNVKLDKRMNDQLIKMLRLTEDFEQQKSLQQLLKQFHELKTYLNNRSAKFPRVSEFNESESLKLSSIQTTILRIKQKEYMRLIERQQANIKLAQQAVWVVLLGTIFTLGIVFALIWSVLKEFKLRFSLLRNAESVNVMKNNFISIASHEFRTPLSTIALSASLIEKYTILEDKGSIQKHTNRIINTVYRLKIILDDFLSLDRLNTGTLKPKFTEFDLVGLTEEVLDEQREFALKGQKLAGHYIGHSTMVILDKNLVRNAMVNLISNALKYGGNNINVMVTTEIDKEKVSITIKDNGIGIPMEEQSRLFIPFFRTDTTAYVPGTGLGLNIVKRYVELMNGKFLFSSIPYQETWFRMIFPAYQKPNKAF